MSARRLVSACLGRRLCLAAARLCLAAAGLFLAAGCGVELEHGLDERQANQIASLLEDRGITADKLRDDGTDGWKLVVPRAELGRAFQLLEANDLPRRGRRGLTETLADRGLLPSLGEEQARIESARGVEIERTLERIPGVLSARVHLALPDPGRLDGPQPPARASVLLRTDRELGVKEASLRALVSGAVSGLAEHEVSLVVARAQVPPDASVLEPVGPLRVARGQKGRVVAIAASGLALLVALGAALLVTAFRLSRPREAAPSAQSVPLNRKL